MASNKVYYIYLSLVFVNKKWYKIHSKHILSYRLNRRDNNFDFFISNYHSNLVLTSNSRCCAIIQHRTLIFDLIFIGVGRGKYDKYVLGLIFSMFLPVPTDI